MSTSVEKINFLHEIQKLHLLNLARKLEDYLNCHHSMRLFVSHLNQLQLLILGHFCAIAAIVGLPTYPTPIQQIFF